MLRKTPTSIRDNVSTELIDDDYVRKFRLKSFYIKLDKVLEKPTERYHERNSRMNCSVNVPKLSVPTKRSEICNELRPKCSCGCGKLNDEYYKKLFNIRECRIALPRVTASKTNKRKLAAIYDTHTSTPEQENCKKFKCKDFSIKLPTVLAGREKTKASDSTVRNRNIIKNAYDICTMKSFVIELQKFAIKERIIVRKLDSREYETVSSIKDFTIRLFNIRGYNQVIVNKFATKNFTIDLPKLSMNVYHSNVRTISSVDEPQKLNLARMNELKNIQIILPRLTNICGL